MGIVDLRRHRPEKHHRCTTAGVILVALFLARTTMAFQFQSVAALAPLVAADHGVGLADIGLLIGLYFAPGIVIAIPGGAVARRLGDRRVFVGGMALMLAGGLLPALSASWAALVAGRLVAGIGGVVLNVQLAKMLTDWFVGREIATAMAVLINAWPIGIATALLILPVLAAPGSLAPAWLAVLALVAAGLALFLLTWRAPPDLPREGDGPGRVPPSRLPPCRSPPSPSPGPSGRSTTARSSWPSASGRHS
ncbi:MAG: MFS transporter [Geminicoccaceae bacterium]